MIFYTFLLYSFRTIFDSWLWKYFPRRYRHDIFSLNLSIVLALEFCIISIVLIWLHSKYKMRFVFVCLLISCNYWCKFCKPFDIFYGEANLHVNATCIIFELTKVKVNFDERFRDEGHLAMPYIFRVQGKCILIMYKYIVSPPAISYR